MNAPAPSGETLDEKWNRGYQTIDWSVHITIYRQGSQVGEGSAHGAGLADSLQAATESSLSSAAMLIAGKDDFDQLRFRVTFDYFPAHKYSFIEYRGRGIELLGNRVTVREIDTGSVKQQINDSLHYLLGVMHPELHGFYRFYDAGLDQHEASLRTVYSASSLYTLLKLYQLDHDPELEKNFRPIAGFILSRQLKDGPNTGGFYYSYNPETEKNLCVVVTGTASKTIFTLIELNALYRDDPQYLQAARNAADWLLTMIMPDGRVNPLASCTSGSWQNEHKQSFLYSGQVLSALSRLYAVTHDQRYLDGATLVARHFANEVARQGLLVGDGYRPANSISSSWILMSLIDYSGINSEPEYRDLVHRLASMLVSRQIKNPEDAYNDGRYLDAMTSSGNGWINEVMGRFYAFCMEENSTDCRPYRQAIIASSRWLLQNAYNRVNTYDIKNPGRASGGFIYNFRSKTVRTDAVCHGLNSLMSLLKITGDEKNVLLALQERPLIEILPLLRSGPGNDTSTGFGDTTLPE